MTTMMSTTMVMMSVLMNMMLLTMAESKMMGSIQSSVGPSTVGYKGMGQGVADGMKLYVKTGMESSGEYMSSELMMLMMMLSLTCWLIMPMSKGKMMMNMEWSLWYMLMMSGMGVFGVLMGGNMGESMYGKMGGMSGVMQMMSNEMYMGLVWMMVMGMSGSVNMSKMQNNQMGHKNMEMLWLMFTVMMMNMLGELQSAPVDMTEGESELVSGYNMEYSGMWFGGYFMGEYGNMLLESYMMGMMMGGGMKTSMLVTTMMMWVSSILPSMSMDKVMKTGWTKMLPMMMGYYMMMVQMLKMMDGYS